MRVRTAVVGILIVAIAAVGWSDTTAHGRSVDDVVQEIRSELSLGADEAIDPDAVPEALLIELGDAVMAEHVGDETRHEWMDEMMGGEGSESLDAAHKWMAYQYLAGGYPTGPGYGMMGGPAGGRSMMGTWGGQGRGMMGSPNGTWPGYAYESPRDILDRRYASGEISRREYRQMLDDLE